MANRRPWPTRFMPGDKITLLYFSGVRGVVDRIDERGRVWVTLDRDVLDTRAGESAPISVLEMELDEGAA